MKKDTAKYELPWWLDILIFRWRIAGVAMDEDALVLVKYAMILLIAHIVIIELVIL